MHKRAGLSNGRGVFIDRDGTLTEEVGYVNHPSRLRLIDGSSKAIGLLNTHDIPVILTTNQAGVARGYFTEGILKETHRRLSELLASEGDHLDGIYYCPHHPSVGEHPYKKDCDCRKPRPGLILTASRELNVTVEGSYCIGDKITDIEMGKSLNMKGIFVLTGYGLGEWTYQRENWNVKPDFIAENLLNAVEWILREEGIA